MRQDLLKTGRPLVDDDQPVGPNRLGRPDTTGLVGSRHARITDQIEAPADDLTLEQAERLCGEVTRAWMGDFAPALILLDAKSRRRMQAVLTMTRTAVDFCLQPGVEGERVAALNRLHFEVEAALDGDPRGQPAHLLIADEENRESWDRAAWDSLFNRLRHLAMLGSLDVSRARQVTEAMAAVMQGEKGGPLGSALATLLQRGEMWRFEDGDVFPEPNAASQADARGAEDRVDRGWLRFATYVQLAERRLAARAARGRRGRLGLPTRLHLLLRARLVG